ncbi:flagellar hook-associated protein FlgK [Idiomarina abyssalis]|jgi:flagellar hook-associated protein 1 FlgK|uniref:Flagellar hook-associated protein 1 n=1 Tax=Idiomarina abyssalis TaxID=86102 RepID=A0A8I1G3U0_9GAMM|nr:flagellar hook-associated protein FlgK [Idiomarina abyssalis]KPD22132.1 flagellar hook-associated protein [Idiomarina abyssalis]MBJ7265395.1 flagellar hook-associated protein FlgK [Idiomarina abyssalis]MBJ7274071.1 flagellar hook-associated protein FlgK [Idiomarina abyssalis]MBJ7315219.1 flagellar hook-associated protein FlgK [Idiomarina abyssalis]SFT34931.1 flagellar hook-associated protein 1 FlgK [Idiomarina abyssalis]|tara:strand:- start:5900 stop:7915 length:2016 start_codon:yes stop_codon:yes gene_type:complete
MSFDLLNIGKNGILAHQQSLQVTGQNINNTNTPSYVRERTEYFESQFGGLERVRVERMIDQFANRQLRTDISKVSYYEANLEQAEQLDTLLGDSTTNVASSVESFFNTLQDANNDPGSVTARQLVLAEADAMVTKFNDFSQYLDQQKSIINDRLTLSTDRINSISENLAELNSKIQSSNGKNSDNGDINALLNKRDEQLRQLAELVQFSTVEQKNGAVAVNLKNGQPLVLEDGRFNAVAVKSNPDTERLEMVLQKEHGGGKTSEFYVPTDEVGGSVGGYLEYRDEVLMPTQKRLGQLAIRIADSMNTQNQKGMDLDNQLGRKIFDLSKTESEAIPYSDNGGTGEINVSVLEGDSKSFPSENLRITKTGNPDEYEIVPINSDGTIVSGADTITVTQASPGTVDITELGISLDLTGAANAGDQFLAKPAESAASEISLAIRRPEDIALANPIRVKDGMNNQGAAGIEIAAINTPDDYYDTTNNTLLGTAPARIEVTGQTGNAYDLDVFDKDGNLINSIAGTTDLNGILGQAGLADPDYEVDINGEPAVGDEYFIEYNTNGFDDNSNGQSMADLQRQQLVRRSGGEEAEPTMTFNESYGRLVSDVGSRVSQNRVLRDSAEAIKSQTEALYDSQAGVNLEEEAANLIQYQQAYTASARIITTSQTIFDTLLNSLR